jgi:hypothetical protein
MDGIGHRYVDDQDDPQQSERDTQEHSGAF